MPKRHMMAAPCAPGHRGGRGGGGGGDLGGRCMQAHVVHDIWRLPNEFVEGLQPGPPPHQRSRPWAGPERLTNQRPGRRPSARQPADAAGCGRIGCALSAPCGAAGGRKVRHGPPPRAGRLLLRGRLGSAPPLPSRRAEWTAVGCAGLRTRAAEGPSDEREAASDAHCRPLSGPKAERCAAPAGRCVAEVREAPQLQNSPASRSRNE